MGLGPHLFLSDESSSHLTVNVKGYDNVTIKILRVACWFYMLHDVPSCFDFPMSPEKQANKPLGREER